MSNEHNNKINVYFSLNNSINFKDPSGLSDLGWGSPTGPAIPYSHLPPSPPVYNHYFGDGGIFTRQTFSELLSGKERSKRICKSTWSQRFWNNFDTTNAALPGFGAPTGLGALTSGTTADGLQTMTLVQWGRSGFGGSVSGAATFTASETAVGVAVGSAINALLVTSAYEGGVVIGSAVNASNGYRDFCPCGQ